MLKTSVERRKNEFTDSPECDRLQRVVPLNQRVRMRTRRQGPLRWARRLLPDECQRPRGGSSLAVSGMRARPGACWSDNRSGGVVIMILTQISLNDEDVRRRVAKSTAGFAFCPQVADRAAGHPPGSRLVAAASGPNVGLAAPVFHRMSRAAGDPPVQHQH